MKDLPELLAKYIGEHVENFSYQKFREYHIRLLQTNRMMKFLKVGEYEEKK